MQASSLRVRETVEEKALRFIAEGRMMRIHRADEQSVLARVDGDSGTYRLVLDRSGILCFCPARGRWTASSLRLDTSKQTTHPKKET